ncbi:MAG: hypothetical protein NTV51_04300 [Verrucomicrobia bacterium]|nr:hypothetical protein [Verrucomicrobiota bacterium]
MSTITATAPVAGPRSDFPTWLPPMLVKELRQGLRTRGFVGAFIVFQLLMVLMMIATVTSASMGNEAARASTAQTVNAFFWTLLSVQLLIVTPARALGSLQTEADSRTLDLLLLTRLSAWRIVFGKWASLLAQAALLLVAMLPYGIVRYFGGSVDLVSDAGLCAALLGGCAVVTAAGLWASGLPKLIRIAVPVVAIFFGQIWQNMFRSTSVLFAGSAPVLWYLDGALVLVFFLVTAVRRIAPPAENHVLLARGLPLLALVPVPLWALGGATAAASAQWSFAAIFLAVVCAIELASVRVPMAAHWRGWARRGLWGRCVGRVALPGWSSAMLYALVAAALVAFATTQPGVVPLGEIARYVWLVVLALVALLFPVIALSLAEKAAAKTPGGIYVLVFGGMSTFGAIAAGMSSMFPVRYTGFETFARVLPVSGFWLSMGKDGPSTEVVVGQAAFALIVFVIAVMQSRTYWKQLALFEARSRTTTP